MHRVTGSPGATADSSGPSRGGASMQDKNHRCVEKQHTEARPQGQKHAKLQTRFTHRPMPSVIALNSSLLLCERARVKREGVGPTHFFGSSGSSHFFSGFLINALPESKPVQP